MRRALLINLLLALVIFFDPLLSRWPAIQVYAQGPRDILTFAHFQPPRTAAESAGQFNERAQMVIDAAACGMDATFRTWLLEHEDSSVEEPHTEELTAIIIAKIFKYYQLRHEAPDGGEFEFRATFPLNESPCFPDFGYESPAPDDPDFRASCHDNLEELQACLRRQVNRALLAIRIVGHPGTSGNPCILGDGVVVGTTHGEYDVILRNLVRILLMRPANTRGNYLDVLDQATYEHLRNERLTLDGGPGLQSYAVTDCGNTEEHTGSPEERADDYTFAEDFGDALEEAGSSFLDALDWFLVHVVLPLLVIAAAAGAIGLVAALATFLGIEPAAVVAAGLGAALIISGDPLLPFTVCTVLPGFNFLKVCRVPETENHLLMIETSRYLTNQIFRSDLEAMNHSVPSAFNNWTNGLRGWMLDHFRQFLIQDFDEYNARPYQRYSVNAILNMYDFAADDTLRRAAGMVLDYLSAKFAVGSNQGRRVVPFRRLTENANRTYLYEMAGGADHQVGRFLVLAGLTGLIDVGDIGRQESRLQETIYAAVSSYRLPAVILDLAIDKSTPYVQRIHHAGIEVYASSTGYLLSAGGIETGYANQVAFSGRNVDRGAAVPTVLIPTAGILDRNDLIRFEGGEAHDGNTCVTQGFACGLNPTIPALYDACRTDNGNWTFINTVKCALPGAPDPEGEAGNPGPYLYIALYSEACNQFNDSFCVTYAESCSEAEAAEPARFPYCTSQEQRFGFLEVKDAPQDPNDAIAGFQDFMHGVLEHNPSVMSVGMIGSYLTTDGRRIQFDPGRGQKASDEWAILAINGAVTEYEFDDWDLGEGDIIEADGGRITIRNPHLGDEIHFDFSDRNQPGTSVPNDIDRER